MCATELLDDGRTSAGAQTSRSHQSDGIALVAPMHPVRCSSIQFCSYCHGTSPRPAVSLAATTWTRSG